MSFTLPAMSYADGSKKFSTVQFGGYNHNLGYGDGTIWDEKNMTSDLFPILSPRKARYLRRTLTAFHGMYAHDGLYYVDGTTLYLDGTAKLTGLSDTEKVMANLGAYLVILPDKVWYNRLDGSHGNIEQSVLNKACTIKNGTYGGEAADANTIVCDSVNFENYFKAGDAISITGATKHPENNTGEGFYLVVREVDGHELRFYENTFTIAENGDTETLSFKREMPDLDFLCENENRLWGCKGNTIYASKLGDVRNWNVFDGLASDSYAASVGSEGDFTGCVSYLGYPCFFKEESIYKVYGSKPSNFQVMGSANLGVAKGSGHSLAVAGETLFYLSRAGIVAYSGGIPQNISAAFGTDRYQNAVGGSDGRKYYVSMKGPDGWRIFVYDTEKSMWNAEDDTEAQAFEWSGGELYMAAGGKLWVCGNPISATGVKEDSVSAMVEFGDFIESSPNKKGHGKVQIRVELEAGAELSLSQQFDSNGTWVLVKKLTATAKRSYYLSTLPRRCDHFKIKLEGTGVWRLYSLVRESYIGSEL